MDLNEISLANLRNFEEKGERASSSQLNESRERLLEAMVCLIFLTPDREHELPNEVRASPLYSRIKGRVAEAFVSLQELAIAPQAGILQSYSQRGGRGENFDGLAEYRTPGGIVRIKVEQKRGESIHKQPQFAQYYVVKPEIQGTFPNYAEFMYDGGFVSQLCAIAEVPMIERDVYLREVSKTNSPLEPFAALRLLAIGNDEINSNLKEISYSSISEYLAALDGNMPHGIALEGLQETLDTQQGKYFLSIHDSPDPYVWETFDPADLQLTGEHSLKARPDGRFSSLLLRTKGAATIEMLLRWKNRQPILGPAWQVKLSRESS